MTYINVQLCHIPFLCKILTTSHFISPTVYSIPYPKPEAKVIVPNYVLPKVILVTSLH